MQKERHLLGLLSVLSLVLVACPANAQSVLLKWTYAGKGATCGPGGITVAPITAFNVYRVEPPAVNVIQTATAGTKIAGVGAATLTYTDASVLYGHNYLYQVTAWSSGVCGDKESIFSNPFTVNVPLKIIITAPDPPAQQAPVLTIP